MLVSDQRRAGSLAIDVLRYFLDHPTAQDTFEGIAQWWVLERCIETNLVELERVLDALVVAGHVIKRKDRGVEVRYQLNGKRMSEVRELVLGDEKHNSTS